MKKMIKIVGIFVSFLLGNLLLTSATVASQSASVSMNSIIVHVGETVGFNLTAMFGKMADPKEMWAIAPDGVRLELTNTAMLVISDVQLSDTGPYHFHARNFEKEMEYIVNLYVLEWEPEVEFVSADPLFFRN